MIFVHVQYARIYNNITMSAETESHSFRVGLLNAYELHSVCVCA